MLGAFLHHGFNVVAVDGADLMTPGAEQWAHAIAASVAPVVIISASALLCLALYNRLAAIVNRMRGVQRERLELQERLESLTARETEQNVGVRLTCILEGLGNQTAHIRRRARLIRNALLCLLATIGSLVICSLLNGITVFFPGLAPIAAVLFVLGLTTLFAAVVFAAGELTAALAPAEFETQIVSELTGTGSSEATPMFGHLARRRRAEETIEPATAPIL